MMKSITAALAAFFFSLPSFAQWQGDSTVAIVAYWAKGDRAVYKTEAVVKQVQDSVETVQHKSGGTAERHSINAIHIYTGWPVALVIEQVVRIKNDESCFDQVSLMTMQYAGSSLDEPASEQ